MKLLSQSCRYFKPIELFHIPMTLHWRIEIMKTGKITKQDINLLSFTAEYRFLTVKQLAALARRSDQAIRRRLRYFSSEHLVLINERGLGHGPGRRENIVILTETGMDLLNDKGILSKHAIYTTNKGINYE